MFVLDIIMDSQLTLVSGDAELAMPDPAFGAATVFDFERDVMTSTNATVRGQSYIRYSVRTVKAGLVGMSLKTIICKDERTLATVQRRDMVPDLLTLGSETMNLGNWLKTPMFSSFPVSFKEEGETYVWKEEIDSGILTLYQGTGTNAIARFYPSYYEVTQVRKRITYRAHLDLRPEADLTRQGVCVLRVNCTEGEEECESKGARRGHRWFDVFDHD